MQLIKVIIAHLLLAVTLWGLWQPLGNIPAPVSLLDPKHGILGSALPPDIPNNIEGLAGPLKVSVDSFGVPIIYANSEADAYFMQGYLTARDRLWQMDFMARIAAGRLSEILGPDQLETDRYLRRIGMVTAAQAAASVMMANDTTRSMLLAYCSGVNQWIKSLPTGKLPIEFKMLGYRPEPWSPFRAALILKLMCLDLTGYSEDIERTAILRKIGPERYAQIFPMYPDPQAPIIPGGSQNIQAPLPLPPDTSFLADALIAPFDLPGASPFNGSNNWAVDGTRSTTGFPVLCNDPHLRLSLPPIWYEAAISCGEMLVHGVSIPGTPGIIIGFNKNVAWGLTNASRDVWDWYAVNLDPKAGTILLDGKQQPVTYRLDTILVKGGNTVIDTVWETPFGPVVYDPSFRKEDKPVWLALHWQAHTASNEPMFFYQMNHARNRQDCINALPWFETPAQNVIFADTAGIGICQAGTHLVRPQWHGVFILDGTRSSTLLSHRIPAGHNPQTHQSTTGFLFSANQHPTDSVYPYPVYGIFDHCRGRRIQQCLRTSACFLPEQVRDIQSDVVSLKALEASRLLFRHLLSESYPAEIINAWKAWYADSCPYLARHTMPTLCEFFCDSLMKLVWDDWQVPGKIIRPDETVTFRMLTEHADAWYVDRPGTARLELVSELIVSAFEGALQHWNAMPETERFWGEYMQVRLQHYTRLPVWGHTWKGKSGSPDCINALGSTHRPSVRFSVVLGPHPWAWIHLPGGQSGYPASPQYIDQLDLWKSFRYRKVELEPKLPQQQFTIQPS